MKSLSSLVMLLVGFQSAGSSNNGAGGINLGPVVGGRRPPSQQSFHSSKNNHSHHSRHQTTSAPSSTPRNACQLPEIATRCIRKYTHTCILCVYPCADTKKAKHLKQAKPHGRITRLFSANSRIKSVKRNSSHGVRNWTSMSMSMVRSDSISY